MSRIPLSLLVGDVSALARKLRERLEELDRVPSHVEMLNLLAKAGGYKNFQHMKAAQASPAEAANPAVEPQVDMKRVKKAARYFELDGRMIRWPKKHNMRVLCLWVLWSRLPARLALSELEIDERLSLDHTFCDHALLRRFMVDNGMVTRTTEGSEYRRVEARPPSEALAVLKLLQ